MNQYLIFFLSTKVVDEINRRRYRTWCRDRWL